MNISRFKSQWNKANPKWKEFSMFQKLFGEKGLGLILLIITIILLMGL